MLLGKNQLWLAQMWAVGGRAGLAACLETEELVTETQSRCASQGSPVLLRLTRDLTCDCDL